MTDIVILPHHEICPEGAAIEADVGESICEALLRNDIDIEHACEMSCACTTCHVIIREGEDNVSEMAFEEEDKLDSCEGVTLRSRLGCQSKVQGDLTVEIPPTPY